MENFITRVSRMFSDRYGTQLRIESKTGATKAQFSGQSVNNFVYSRTLRQVSFPIFDSNRKLKAIATASPVENKDAIIFDEMAQFVQLTLAEYMQLTELSDFRGEQIKALERLDSDPSKVIQLRTKKRSEYQYIEYKKQQPKGNVDLKPIWIHGNDEALNAQIAFAVHDWVGNWAFINAKEIPDLIWEDHQGWQNFPQVTLFIPGGEDFDQKKIDCIHRNLDRLRHQKGPQPLIVIASQGTLSPEVETIRQRFKCYNTHKNLTAKIQAHFLLFHHKPASPWTHEDRDTKGVFFLPFSMKPENFH